MQQQFYTVEQLGPKRSVTPDGFLVCHDVPIARTGEQIYGPGETPLQTGDAGLVRIERDVDEVFRPEAVASLDGKPVVVEHPIGADGSRCDVTSENWRDLVVGHVLHPRRAEVEDDDGELIPALVADLLIWDQNAIAQINDGKREVSCGYAADYEELGPGHGRQVNIIHNHLALVDAGRCGSLCSIGDSEISPPDERKSPMATIAEKIRNLFREAGDEAAALAEREGRDGEHHVHVHVGDGAPPARRRTRDADQEVPRPTETVTAENPPPIEQIDQPPPAARGEGNSITEMVGRHDDEIEQLLEANEIEREAIESLAGGNGDSAYDAAPFRDGMAKAAAIRDAIRQKRGKPRDQAAPTPLPEASPTGGTGQPDFEMEAPPGTLDHARRATDSAWMQTSWDETISWAEIVVPGIRLPVFDSRQRPRQTFNALCAFRARVLDAAYNMPDGREIIDSLELAFPGGAKLSCQDAKRLLKGVHAMKARLNTGSQSGAFPRLATVDTMGTNLGAAIPAGPSLPDMAKQIEAYYRGERG